MEKISVVGLDLAKNTFHIHCANDTGKCILSKRVSRKSLLKFFANLPCCLVGMEACGSSHYWARHISSLGHQVKLIPPQYVKPFVKTNKNDAADAEAISEAVVRENMRFVEVKTPDQQALLLIHRERDGVIRDRTAVINRIRAALLEFGVVVPAGPCRFKAWFRTEFATVEGKLSGLLRKLVVRMMARLEEIEQHIKALDSDIDQAIVEDEKCQRLLEVPGIGRLTASALVASVGNAQNFKSARQFSAWLGLVPRQHSTGGRNVLLGISKQGDGYLRRLLIHGARAVVRHMNQKRQVLYQWLSSLRTRAHFNVVIVALANKLARIAWALLSKGCRYKEPVLI